MILIGLFIMINVQVNAQENKEIFNAFKQGVVKGGGNCVSIALIKAGFSKYGFDSLFLETKKEDSLYTILLRDGTIVKLGEVELKQASEKAGFKLKDSTRFSIQFKSFAEFCFAVICKRAESINKHDSYNAAIDDVNNGYTTKISNKLLGLKFKKIRPYRASKIKSMEHLIVYNTVHAVYASKGYYDEVGSEYGLSPLCCMKWNRFSYKCFWKLCGISGAYMIVD